MWKHRAGSLTLAVLAWTAAFFLVAGSESLLCDGRPLTRCPHGILLWAIAAGLMAGLALLTRPGSTRARKETSIALLDPLTGLENRRSFTAQVRPLMEAAGRLSEKALVLVVSVNRFDAITAAGGDRSDRAALLVADALRDSLRGSDLIARYNEDEFVCFLGKASLMYADIVADRIRENVAAQNRHFPGPGALEVTVGVSELDPLAAVSLEKLVKAAYDDLFEKLRADGV